MAEVPTVTLHDADLKTKRVGYHDRVIISKMGSLALDFMKMHLPASMLADAVNSDGMQKLSFDEIVDRSIRLTELAYSALDGKGWVATLPEIDAMVDDGNPAGFAK